MALDLFISIDGDNPHNDANYNGDGTLNGLKNYIISHYYPGTGISRDDLMIQWINDTSHNNIPVPIDLTRTPINKMSATMLPIEFNPNNVIILYCTNVSDPEASQALYITARSINFIMQVVLSLIVVIFSLVRVATGDTAVISIFLPIVTLIVAYWFPSPSQQKILGK